MSKTKEPTGRLAVVLVLIVVAMWGANWLLAYCLPNRGTFGDMFGAVNALFTGLAFAAVIYAILIQRHEVELLKSELDQSKSLIRDQQTLAQVQISAQNKQQFEATFFNLLHVFNDLVEGIDLRETSNAKQVIASGRDAFASFAREIQRTHNYRSSLMYEDSMDRTFDVLEEYEAFYKKHKSDLGHYFRTLYNLFKYLDRSHVENKRVYSNLVRAQLSDDEAFILFLNGLSERGREKFKRYLEVYTVLKNVDREDKLVKFAIEDAEKQGVRYSETAFVKSDEGTLVPFFEDEEP